MLSTSDNIVCARCSRSVSVNKSDHLDEVSRICTMCSLRGNQQTFTKPIYISSQLTPKWICTLGYIRFDLQLGQTIDCLYPPLPLSDDQDKEIAFYCFPDANFHIHSEKVFHDFICTVNPAEFTGKRISVSPSIPGPQGRKSFTHDSEELFCTSLFCQVKSNGATRGALQSALVCMTQLPMPEVTRAVLSVLFDCLEKDEEGALQKDQPIEIFKRIYEEVYRWGPVCFGSRHILSLQGRSIDITVPELLGSDLGVLQWSGVSGSFPAFGPQTPSEDLLELVESVAMELSAEIPWPRILGKVQMLPSTVRNQCCATLSECGWDGVSLNFSISDGGQTLCSLSKVLRQEKDVIHIPFNNEGSISLKTMLLLFNNPLYYPSAIVGIQNEQLRTLLASATDMLSRVEGAAQPASPTQQHVGMGLDLPSPFSDLPLGEALWPHISRVLKLWELVIAGESILFLGADVPIVSSACLATASLISPLRFEGVLRPYLTISNRETDILLTADQSQMPTLVGATNPFFIEKCVTWPNLVCFGPMGNRPHTSSEIVRYLRSNHSGGKVSAHTPSVRSDMQFTLTDAMFSKRHFCVKSDRLTAEVSDGGIVGDDVLRKMLKNLTSAFLTPIHDYIVGTLRAHRPFFTNTDWQHELLSPTAVFSAIQKAPTLPHDKFKSRSDMLGLYVAFLETPTFRRWRQALCAAVERELIMDAPSLEDVLYLDACPQTRFQVLNYLQCKLHRCLNDTLCDVDFLKSLVRHLANVCEIRDRLAERNSYLSSL